MSDPHFGFILAAYAVTGLVVGGLVLRAALDHRAQRGALRDLEARGLRRRSAGRRDADKRETAE